MPVPPCWPLPGEGVLWCTPPLPRCASDVLPPPALPTPVTAGTPLFDGLGPLPVLGGGATWVVTETGVGIAAGAGAGAREGTCVWGAVGCRTA